MPIKPENKHRYPADWPEIRARILARAGNCCEWCGVPNYALGHRDAGGRFHPAHGNEFLDRAGQGGATFLEASQAARHLNDCCDGMGPDGERAVVIVLTIAHYPDPSPENCAPANLHGLCQRCHNRVDGPLRRSGARQTRERRSGQGRLKLEGVEK